MRVFLGADPPPAAFFFTRLARASPPSPPSIATTAAPLPPARTGLERSKRQKIVDPDLDRPPLERHEMGRAHGASEESIRAHRVHFAEGLPIHGENLVPCLDALLLRVGSRVHE